MVKQFFLAIASFLLISEAPSIEICMDKEVPKGVAVVVGCTGKGLPFRGITAQCFFNKSTLSPEAAKFFGNHDHADGFGGRRTYTVDINPAQVKTKCTHIQTSWFDFKPQDHFKEPIDVLFFENFPPAMYEEVRKRTSEPALVEAIHYGTPLLAPGGEIIIEVVPDIIVFTYTQGFDIQDLPSWEPEGTSPFRGIYLLDFAVWKKAFEGVEDYKRLGAAMKILEKELPFFKSRAKMIFEQPALRFEEMAGDHNFDFLYGIAALATILDKGRNMKEFLENLGYVNVSFKGYRDNPYNHRRISYHLKGTKPLLSVKELSALQKAYDIFQKTQSEMRGSEAGA